MKGYPPLGEHGAVLRMQPGRNAKRRKLIAPAVLGLFLGAACLALPASALDAGSSASGAADALWGSYTGVDSPPIGADQDLDGASHTAANAYAGADITPPDPQPALDAATGLAMEAAGTVQGQADGALSQAQQSDAGMTLDYGVKGGSDGTYDVVLGGDYAGNAAGVAGLDADKSVDQKVDVGSHTDEVNDLGAQLEAAVNGALDGIGGLVSKLQVSADLGLKGAANAIGQMGVDIAGIFSTDQAAQLVNLDSIDATQHVETPAIVAPQAHVDIPDVEVPDLSVDQSGQVAADASAIADGAVHGP
jgi:hypothetical protein